jgi:aryl-alcohol dehydrogenase-like predicted oxidoreductase
LAQRLTDEASVAKVRRLLPIADSLGCSMAQLALAWCARNPRVSTVITGASRVSQVRENFGALDVIPLLDDEVLGRIDEAVKG